MALVKCTTSFSYPTAGGPRTIAAGELLDESDPAVTSRRSFFSPTAAESLTQTGGLADGSVTASKLAADALAAAVAVALAQLPASNGTDDAPAINAVLAAAAGKRVRGLPGTSYVIGSPLTLPSGGDVELDMTGCTITLNAGANCQMLRNYAHTQGSGTDTNITVTGGTWARGTVGASADNMSQHSLVFQRVTGLKVTGVTYTSTSGSKYGILVYACTRFDVGNITFACCSDGVHVSGASKHGYIHDIKGSTGDDGVGITPADYAQYQNGDLGDISHLTIERIFTSNPGATGSGVAVYCESGTNSHTINIRDVAASSGMASLTIGGIGTGVVYNITAENITNIGTGHVVILGGPAAVQAIVLRNIGSPTGASKYAVQVDGGLAATDITIEDCSWSFVVNGYAVNMVASTPANTIATLRIVNCRLTVATSSGGLIQTNQATNVISNLHVGNYRVERCTWGVGNFSGGSTNLFLSNVQTSPGTTVSALFNAAPGATVNVHGASGVSVNPNIGSSGATVNSYDLGFKMDVGLLAKVAGGMAYNTNAARSCGVGPVVCDGTNWKHLFTGATY